MLKIAHLTSVHPTSDIRIFEKECRSLARAGYEVVLVVPHTHDEVKDGVHIVVVAPSKSRLDRIALTSWRVFRKALAQQASLYHFHDPELILPGLLLKLLGKKVIYDVHEDLPRQVLSKPWIPVVLRQSVSVVTEALETFAVRLFDGVVTVTPTIAKRFPQYKTALVQNFPMQEELILEAAKPYAQRRHVVYVGGIAVIRGIREMILAMQLLPNTVTEKLVLAGSFRPAELENEMKQLPGWARVEARGWQSRDEIAALLYDSKIGLVVLHPIVNYVDSLPIKLFEYMAAGVPVIASNFPLWREIVEDARCGLLVDPLNPQAVADAMTWLLTHPEEAEAMGERGQKAVQEKYNWALEAKKLIALYKQLQVIPD
jgi:glycosyltransferase involved in cell wall biosynthesis